MWQGNTDNGIVPALARWRLRRRVQRSQRWLATGSGVRMMSASLTTLDRDPIALGWLNGHELFSEAPTPDEKAGTR